MANRFFFLGVLTALLAGCLAAEDQVQYTGTYTNPAWEGGKMTIIIANQANDEGKRPATVNCTWDGEFYTYSAHFQPLGDDNVLQGICASEDDMGDPANYVIKGTVKDGTYSAYYWMEGDGEPESAEDADGTITLVVGATPMVTEDSIE